MLGFTTELQVEFSRSKLRSPVLSVCLMMSLLGSIIFAGQLDSILALGIPYKSAGDVECGSILPKPSIFLKRQALVVVRSFLVGISR